MESSRLVNGGLRRFSQTADGLNQGPNSEVILEFMSKNTAKFRILLSKCQKLVFLAQFLVFFTNLSLISNPTFYCWRKLSDKWKRNK